MDIQQWFCRHTYDILNNYKVEVFYNNGKLSHYTQVMIQRCAKCGKIQKVKYDLC